MMPLATSLENAILNEIFGGTNYVPLTNLFLGLSSTAPTKAGGNITEPAGGGYARVQIANNATNFPAASASSKANGAVFTFPEATASWGAQLTHWVIFDALTGGAMQCFGSVATPKTVDLGDTPSFNTGTLTISMA